MHLPPGFEDQESGHGADVVGLRDLFLGVRVYLQEGDSGGAGEGGGEGFVEGGYGAAGGAPVCVDCGGGGCVLASWWVVEGLEGEKRGQGD